MKKYRLCLWLLLACVVGFAARANGHRILFLLDGSSSMSLPYEKGQTRFQKAAATILSIMDSISAKENDVEFALRVYGHQCPAQEKNCFDSKMEVSFSKGNRAQMELRLDNLKPAGISPLSYAIHEAVFNDLQAAFNYSIFIISDGDESCGGNICAEVAAAEVKIKTSLRPTLINLGTKTSIKFDCINYWNKSEPDQPLAFYNKEIEKQQNASPNIDTGYILIRSTEQISKLMLYNYNGSIYNLNKQQYLNIIKGERLKVKTGRYKITYTINNVDRSVELTTIKNMITEVNN